MIAVIRDKTTEHTPNIDLPVDVLLTPMLSSNSVRFIIYLIHMSTFPGFVFTYAAFMARTGIKQRAMEKIKNELMEKYNIVDIDATTSGKRVVIKSVQVNYSKLINLVYQPMQYKKAFKKYVKEENPNKKSPLDVALALRSITKEDIESAKIKRELSRQNENMK